MPKSDFSQLVHLPDLVSHFDLHQQEALSQGKAISFAQFIYLHFVEVDAHAHDDSSEHQNLPLNTLSSTSIQFFTAYTVYLLHVIVSIFAQVSTLVLQIPIEEYIPTIFHPPSIL